MVILDTDHVSLLEWGDESSERLRERLANLPSHEVVATIISYEESLRGWMAYIARAKTVEQQIQAYQRLHRHLDNYRQIPLLDFDADAGKELQRLRQARIGIGAMDLKIAAIALASGATLLSCNRVDFAKVPGLTVED
ncbi:MAG: PIN domain-containing protein [Planctomycetales bacterium]|nr:PIN domain-containing protein [Planctomycetales bacterium]NIM09169.1 PIN domain-containing protein [Planctomycetales bacterium]NIN08636.1 PIN domain-containing protein [Planctomycetales bacterium]NIN77762.1 PIN domain-containing protein [Planctomycetales bacterium]NIO34938.1 PIN domain-containing protein [Planctomycetales bacterium]